MEKKVQKRVKDEKNDSETEKKVQKQVKTQKKHSKPRKKSKKSQKQKNTIVFFRFFNFSSQS